MLQTYNVDNLKTPFPNAYLDFCRAWFMINSSSPPVYKEFLLYDIETYKPEQYDPLEIFPKSGGVIKEKIREYLDLIEKLELSFEDRMVRIFKMKKTDHDAMVDLRRILDVDLPKEIYEQHIKRLEHLLRRIKWKRKPETKKGDITDIDIVQAKQVPILEVMGLQPIRGFVHCPFHVEKTASCKIDSTNRYHCFGCSEGGDSIDFVMKKENLSFLEAVKKLCKK